MTRIGNWLLWKIGVKVEESHILIKTNEFFLPSNNLVLAVGVDGRSGTRDQVSIRWKPIVDGSNWYYGNAMIGFHHTHAPWIGAHPSQTDINTMDSWVKATGRDLYCLIESSGVTRGWLFTRDNQMKLVDVSTGPNMEFMLCLTKE